MLGEPRLDGNGFGGKEKIKEKLRAATEAVKERKEAAASEKGSDLEMDKQGDRPDNGAFVDPSLTAGPA